MGGVPGRHAHVHLAGGLAEPPAGGVVDGLGTNVYFGAPSGLHLDAASHRLFVVDAGLGAIRVVALSSSPETSSFPRVSTLAGGGGAGHADGTGSAARFDMPRALAGAGDVLLVAEALMLRAVDLRGRGAVVLTLAGGLGGAFRGYADGYGTSAAFGGLRAAALLPAAGGGELGFAVVDAGNAALRIVRLANCSGGGGGGGGVSGGALLPCAAAPLPAAQAGALALPIFAAAAILAAFAGAIIARRRAWMARGGAPSVAEASVTLLDPNVDCAATEDPVCGAAPPYMLPNLIARSMPVRPHPAQAAGKATLVSDCM